MWVLPTPSYFGILFYSFNDSLQSFYHYTMTSTLLVAGAASHLLCYWHAKSSYYGSKGWGMLKKERKAGYFTVMPLSLDVRSFDV